MVVCLGLVVVQLVNIQLVKAKQLQASPNNPRVVCAEVQQPSGGHLRLGRHRPGQVGAHPGRDEHDGLPVPLHPPVPQGPLYAGITGYDSPLYYGTAGIEEQYDSYLGSHQQPPQTLSQLIFRQSTPLTTDDVTLTVEPSLQQAAWNALTTLPPGENKDGAVVVLDPKTGAVLAMVSNPTYDPNALVEPSLSSENWPTSATSSRTTRASSPCGPSPPARPSSRARP